MRLNEFTYTENLSDLFGKGSAIGAEFNPGVDDVIQGKLQAQQAARDNQVASMAGQVLQKVAPRPVDDPRNPDPQIKQRQQNWDTAYGATHKPDGSVDPQSQTAQGAKGQGSVSYVGDFNKRIRNKPIKPALMRILNKAANEAGVKVVIFSGGQETKGQGKRRTGSTRHDAGMAADVRLYDKNGKILKTDGKNPLVLNFIAAAKRAGARGMGAHPGYMNGTGIHLDLHGSAKGGAMWGAGGKGAPPARIAQAFQTGKGQVAV